MNSSKDIRYFRLKIGTATTSRATEKAISTKIYSVDKKLGKPKLHTMRKIYNAVRFGRPQIVPVRKFGMKVSFFFQVLALKLSK